MKRKHLMFYGLFFMLMLSGIMISSAETIDRDSSYTTTKGTKININATLEHDGIDGSSGKPMFEVNSTYVLSIKVTVIELGTDARDLHDIAFDISLASESLLGGSLSFYRGYFIDKESKLTGGDSIVYDIDLFVSGGMDEQTATLTADFAAKEDVENNIDPTTEYTAFSLETIINKGGSINNPIAGITSPESLNRSMEVFADKETKVRFEFVMGIEKINDTGKPEILSKKAYVMEFKVTVMELGADAEDFHDVSIRATLEDESFKDIIPGNEAKSYYAAGFDETETKLMDGDSLSLFMVFYASTNLNNTDVTLKLQFTGKEGISLGIDPKSEFDLNIEFHLNKGVSNVFDDLTSDDDGLDFPFPVFFFILAIPILKKRRT